MSETDTSQEQNPHLKIIQMIDIIQDRIEYRSKKSDHDKSVVQDLKTLKEKCRENTITTTDATRIFEELNNKVLTLLKIEDLQNELAEWETRNPAQPDDAHTNPTSQINWSQAHESWEATKQFKEGQIKSLEKKLKGPWWKNLF